MYDIRTSESTLVAKVYDFSRTCTLGPFRSEVSEAVIDYDFRKDVFRIYYIASNDHVNEHGLSTGGFGSLSFENIYPRLAVYGELIIFIAVIDTDGNQRFPQSFQFGRDVCSKRHFSIDNFISQSVLLNEPSEFLPNDTLTLHMDFVLKRFVHRYLNCPNLETPTFKSENGPDGSSYYLFLDSLLAKQLREESEFFDRISATPMVEGRSRWMKIPTEEEFRALSTIESIFYNQKDLNLLKTLKEAFELYTMAEKYGIERILNICRRCLPLILSSGNVWAVSNFVKKYQDPQLTKIVETFQREHSEEVKEEDQPLMADDIRNLLCTEVDEMRDSYSFYK